MATTQLQKTRTAKLQTQTTITQKQSLQLMQTMLHGGLSTIAYLRAFFSEKAFDTAYCNNSGSRVPSSQEYPNDIEDEAVAFRQLCRGRSRRADLFLDWLEKGAFVALQQGILESLQVYVHPDALQRDKVIEAYTLTITYHNRGPGSIAGVRLDSPGRPGIAAGTSSGTLKSFIQDVLKTCDMLSDLPEKRFISMALFYKANGNIFKPSGYQAAPATDIQMAHALGWKRHTVELAPVQSSFHTSRLEVSHLADSMFFGMRGIAMPPQMPSTFLYRPVEQPLSRQPQLLEDDQAIVRPGSATLGRTPSTICSPGGDGQTRAASRADTPPIVPPIAVPEPRSQRSQQIRQTSLVQPSPLDALLADSLDTQASNVPRMRSALQGMGIEEHLTQGDTQTQTFARPSMSQAVQPPTQFDKVSLLPAIAVELERSKASLRQKAQKLAKVSARTLDETDVVLCQCRRNVENGDMIECSYCGTWQHDHCYGYSGDSDPRLPNVHACYQCLLGVRDQSVLKSLGDLVLKRQGMVLMLRHDSRSEKGDIAQALGLNSTAAKTVQKFLVEEGLVKQTSRTRTSSKLTSISQLKASEDSAKWEKMLQLLFDPLTHIAQYYEELLTNATVVGRQLRALSAGTMLPPALTPSQQIRKNATTTPGSALDMRASLPRYSTPVVNSGSKRGAIDDPFQQPPAKKQATSTPGYHRLKSVQTEATLNADGLSSPV